MHQNEISEAKNFNKKMSAILSVEGAKFEDVNIFEEEKLKSIGANQKFGLILSLLKIGDWDNAWKLMSKLPEYFCVSYPPICDALCTLIHYLIDPFYRM